MANEPVPEPSSSSLMENVKSVQSRIIEKIGPENSDLALKVWAASLGVALIWVGLSLSGKRNRRAEIKRQISDVSERFRAGIAKYPESFLKHHAAKAQQALSDLEALSNKELDEIIKKWNHKLRTFERKIKDISNAIGSKGDSRKWEKDTRGELQVKFDDLKNQEAVWLTKIADEIKILKKLQDERRKEGFMIQDSELPALQASFSMEEMRLWAEQVLRTIKKSMDDLGSMWTFYSSLRGMDMQVQEEWTTKNNELTKISPEYKKICEEKNLTNWRDLEKQIKEFVKGFQTAFQAKDMKKLTELFNSKNMIIVLMRDYMMQLKQDINWHKDVHTLVIQRQGFLERMREHWPSVEEHVNKQRIIQNVTTLYDILKSVREMHTGKKNIWLIKNELEKFDAIYSDTKNEMRGSDKPHESLSHAQREQDGDNGFANTVPYGSSN